MSLATGFRVGPYVIQSLLGVGGMGEVYRSRDAALNRDVAIKILPDAFALDPDRLARFSREAQTLAALSHPNIAHVYGLVDAPLEGGGHVHALVMEMVEGEDLARRLERGPIPVDEAIPIARQVADALETAHEQGIVHRDVKPANIKIKADGTVKVLDFGLARAAGPAAAASGTDPLASPTMTSPALTAMGVILGTAAYMSPEQARGKPVDRRADIWAFGVVLVEMLTGRRLFPGESISDVMVSVLTRPIDFGALPREVPLRVREMIARCLERDPKRRLRDIGEARVALEASPEEVSPSGLRDVVSSGPPVAAVRSQASLVPWALAIVGLAAAMVFAALWMRAANTSRVAERLQLEIGPPSGTEFVVQSNAGAAVVSPDGSMVAFVAQGASGRRLHVRSLSTGETRAISGSEDAYYAFWSPDSRSLGFFGSSRMLKVSIAGGLPEAIAGIQLGRGGTWTDAGDILFTPVGGGVIHRVSERGGDVKAITALDASRGENAHYWPVALPGGRAFLFFVRSTRPENNGIYLGAVEGGSEPVRLVTSLSSGLYAPPRDGGHGHLLWIRDGELLAQRLDVAAAKLTGEVQTIATDVRVEESQRGNFASVSSTGTLIWASASAGDLELAWFARDGRRLERLPIAPGKVMQPRISPDGRKLAFTRAAGGTADIWLLDFGSGAVTQVTTDPGYDENPSWLADASALVHNGGAGGLVLATIDGSRAPRTMIKDRLIGTGRFLPRRSSLVISHGTAGGTNLAIMSLDDANTIEELSSDTGFEAQAEPSPDGKWLAFVTDRTGRYEVVLARLIDDGPRLRLSAQRLPVSSAGGIDPFWRADGREILYLAPDRTIMSVSVRITGESVSLGKPAPVFRVPADAGGWGSNWTANADATKFIAVDAPRGLAQTFRVLTNWDAGAIAAR